MSTKAKLRSVLLVVIVMGLSLSCNTIAPGKAAESFGLTGTYSLISIDGHPVPYAPTHEGQQAPEVVSSTLTLNSGGTFVSTMSYANASGGTMSRDFKGTYTREGSDFNLKWEGAGQTKITMDGSTLTMDNHGILFVYQK